jgi:ribosome-associated protein
MHTLQSTPIKIALIDTVYIELDKLLKRENLASSGGEAGYLISQGLARVNGVLETRKRRKLYPGDLINCNGVEMRVTEREPCSVANSETEQGD